MATIPAVVTILDLATGTLSTTALLEAQYTSNGVATTIAVTPFQIVSAAFSAGMVVPVPFGGTGTTSLTANGVVYGNGTSPVGVFNASGIIYGNATAALTAIAPGTAFWPLMGNGSASIPSFQQINLTASVTGVLAVPFGGTGTSALEANQVVVGNGTAAVQMSGVATSGLVLTGNGTGSPPTFQSISTAALSGVVWPVSQGGTNTSTLTPFGVVFGNGTSTVGITAAGTTNWALLGNGTAVAPSFKQISLTASVTGVLTVPFGGSGTSTLTAFGLLYGQGTTTFGIIAAATSGLPLVAQGATSAAVYTTLPLSGLTGGTSGLVLMGNATNAAPSYQVVNLSTSASLTGTLPVTFGGVGINAYSAGDLIAASNSTTLARVAAATSEFFLRSTGTASAPSYAMARPLVVRAAITANFTTTTGTFIDVPGSVVSFSLPATSIVTVMVQGLISMNSAAQGLWGLNVDSVDTNVLLAAAAGTNILMPATLFYNTGALSPATHTVKLRARTSDGSSQLTMNFASVANGILQIEAIATG